MGDQSAYSQQQPALTIRRYQRAPGVRWSVEPRGLSMFSEEQGVFCCIPYPFAAIWDLADRDYDPARLVELFRFIAGVEPPVAQQLVARTLRHWVDLKLLVEVPSHG